MCTDCGSAPAHPRGRSYCRRCDEKGGNLWAHRVTIDLDKLDAYLGTIDAEAVVENCKVDS